MEKKWKLTQIKFQRVDRVGDNQEADPTAMPVLSPADLLVLPQGLIGTAEHTTLIKNTQTLLLKLSSEGAELCCPKGRKNPALGTTR